MGLAPMFVIVWRFRARPDKLETFARAYGADGDWVELFRRADGFVATELLRDSTTSGGFMTIDRWRSRADYDRFRERFQAAYADLDARMESLTTDEHRVGQFETEP